MLNRLNCRCAVQLLINLLCNYIQMSSAAKKVRCVLTYRSKQFKGLNKHKSPTNERYTDSICKDVMRML